MFEDFNLSEAILRAVRDEGYRQPTDIQRAAIPEILRGNDVLATAQTLPVDQVSSSPLATTW